MRYEEDMKRRRIGAERSEQVTLELHIAHAKNKHTDMLIINTLDMLKIKTLDRLT